MKPDVNNFFRAKTMLQKRKGIALFLLLIATASLAIFILTGEQRETKRWEKLITELSEDAYLKVGDLDIAIPLVALLEPQYGYNSHSFPPWSSSNKKTEMDERKKFKKLSAKSETAPQVKRIKILIQQYKYYGQRHASLKICAMLNRDWAKHFCKGEFQEVMKKLPEKFYIVDEQHVDLFSYHSTVNLERMSDQIKKLDLKSGDTDISCDADGKFCTAGVRTSSNTLAIWTVWSDEKNGISAKEKAKSEGNSILSFVKHGIGPKSDFTKMKKEIGLTMQ